MKELNWFMKIKMTLLYDKDECIPKSFEYYNRYYDKKDLIRMLREEIMEKNAIIRSRKALKAVITRMKK